jgi:hypothetical protein
MIDNLPDSFAELLIALAGGEGKRSQLVQELGYSYTKISYWAKTNNIHSDAWDDVIALAYRKGLRGVDADYLMSLQRKKDWTRPKKKKAG